MNENRDTLELLARHLILAMDPLRRAVSNEDAFRAFMLRMGWQVDGLPPAYINLGAAIASAVEAVEALADEPELDEILDLLFKAKNIFESIQNIGAAPPGVDAGAFLAEIGERLFEILLTDYLASQLPAAYNLLSTLNVIEVENLPGTAQKTGHIRTKFKWGEIPKILTEPLDLPKRVYGWGTPELKIQRLLQHISEFFFALNFPVSLGKAEELLADAYQEGINNDLFLLKVPFYYITIGDKNFEAAFTLLELKASEGKLPGIILQPQIPQEFPFTFHIAPDIDLNIRAGTNLASLFGVLIRPDEISFKFPFQPGATLPSAGFGVAFDYHPAEAKTLVGNPRGIRLQLKGFKTEFAINIFEGEPEVLLGAEMKELSFVLKAGEGDSFVQKILGDGETKVDIPLGFEWSSKNGIHFKGSAAFEVSLHPHLTLGPIAIEDFLIRFFVPPDPKPKVNLEMGINVAANLGPLHVVVNNIGLGLYTTFEKGNAGPFDIALGFKPPNGVGLSLDAGGFKGGGFLMFDFDKGEYAGALELDFKGMFSVKAIGIINTKMPDGSKGFSLLIVISAEFTPIQLSFGFTLNGVGGIIGLNRSINVPALVDGIRTNAIKSILFPQDVVANITRIISDIKQFFPVQQDHFVVGPMAKLGWGTPSIVTVELGLLLDLPNPMIALVGVLKAVIPAEEAPILRLQVNFIGVLDFEHGYIFFRADLYDSRLLIFSLTGSMAFLVSWGEQKTFALSVGGFHPDFRDIPSIPALPNGFHNMARLGISLLSDDNPRLKVESYFAVTSNTVQFGARVELYAEAMGFNVYGFLGYDVLFQFEPFRFIAKFEAGIALRSGTSVIAGIHISAQLSGPTPWDARGTASLELFWFLTISVGFHVTWGDPPPAVEPATEDLLELLKKEMADTRNWRAEIPANNHLHVSLRQIEPPADSELLVIHPAGVLMFSQRSLPLEDYLIQKFGTKKPLNANKFRLTNAVSGSTNLPADFASVREQFAPANFTEMSDSEKLSRKSFEPLPSGFRLSGTSELHVAMPVSRPVVYELSYLRRKRIVFKRLIDLALVTYNRLVKGSAVRQSALAYQQNRLSLNAPAQVVLPAETFAIANVSDLKSHLADGQQKAQLFATQAEAYQRQQELLFENPALSGQIQVVSHFELNQN